MARTVQAGWRSVTPGACHDCGSDDEWSCDGRGNVTCGCSACPDCGSQDVYGFHEPDCLVIREWEEQEERRLVQGEQSRGAFRAMVARARRDEGVE